jgi:polyphosphate kinase
MEHAVPSAPDRYFSQELSIQDFHRRVLAQAHDRSLPLLERLRFLCITSSIMDEFFEVRVAGLRKQLQFGAVGTAPDGSSMRDILARISLGAHAIVEDQYRLFNDELLPELEVAGIRFLRRASWTRPQEQWIRNYFSDQVLPIMSPIRLDPAHPFPRVLNKALHFIVAVDGVDAFGHAGGMAVVQAPRVLPRFVRIPSEVGDDYDFVFLSSIIHAHVRDLFPGMDVTGCYQFRVTRDSDLIVDEEEIEDLRSAVEGELLSRRYGDEVRLEVADNCPAEISNFLLQQFELDASDLYRVSGPVNLVRLMSLPEIVDRPALKFPPLVPSVPARVVQESSLFDVISRGDLLLHHPFQSFSPVVDFVRQAAADPDVVAIKQTLYRTTSESAIEDALVSAARRGKEVTAVVELRARFDEAANIEIARRLQEAGAHVVYGVVGFKTHAKMLMVIRREGGKLRRYVHLGTGNYNARTTRHYTDFGLLTADAAIGEDVHKIFMQLTSLGRVAELQKLYQAPFSLFNATIERIKAEADAARAGKPARIIAKVNALVDTKVIDALYDASQAGVRVDLIVRAACCLRPGVPGMSENVRVRSIVGRFLEHTRVFYFENGGQPLVYLASADWMARNFHRRIETCFPIEDPRLKEQVIEQGLMVYLSDDANAWELHADGVYRRVTAAAEPSTGAAQQRLLQTLTEPGGAT